MYVYNIYHGDMRLLQSHCSYDKNNNNNNNNIVYKSRRGVLYWRYNNIIINNT